MSMRKILMAAVASLFFTASAGAGGFLDNLTYNLRFGYGIGGTAPMGMPATIRSLESYRLEPNFTLGLGVYKQLNNRWGLTTGLHLENKGMNIDAKVKNYHMSIIKGGQSLDGYFTGMNTSEAEMWMLTLPLQATYSFSQDLHLKFGPYLSYINKPVFRGYASDGYLRVGNPTGTKVMLGSDEGSRGTYDFSDSMRSLQFGFMFGAEYYFHRRWGMFADVSWGVTGVFKKKFKTIEQTLYPVYGTLGVSYRFK